MLNKDSVLNAVAETYADRINEETRVLVEKQKLEESSNVHEATHKKLIGKLHKEFPELNLDKSAHTAKNTSRNGSEEYHTYRAELPIHDTVKHLFKNLSAEVTFAHHQHEGKPAVHGTLGYRYEHPDGGSNGSSVATISNHNGKTHIRTNATGHSKEV